MTYVSYPGELITGVATFNRVGDQYANPLIWPRLRPRDCRAALKEGT